MFKMGSGGIGIPAPEVQLEEEPMYVNAKQYHRILKRRASRAKWEASLKASKKDKVAVVTCQNLGTNIWFSHIYTSPVIGMQ